MKLNLKPCLLALGAICCAALASCSPQGNDASSEDSSGASSSTIDDVVASIKIVEGSIANSYKQGATPKYTDLAIDTYNAANQKISTLKASGNSAITYTEIDTSTVSADKVFTVTYTVGANSFTDTMTYSVLEHTYSLASWTPSATYSSFSTKEINPNISTDSKTETGFIKKSIFRIGNDNAIDLTPSMKAIDEDSATLKTVDVDSFPKDSVDVALYDDAKDADHKSPLNLADYLEDSASLTERAVLKFKDSVLGKFSLVYSYKDKEDDRFQDIVYAFEVVDGYNVTKATDLYAIHNGHDVMASSIYGAGATAFKKEHNIPDAKGLILQSDVVITFADLVPAYIWGGTDNDILDGTEALRNTLKDWVSVFNYDFKEEGTVSVYGNFHRISLGDDFPDIKSDDKAEPDEAGRQHGVLQAEGSPISSHATIFSTTSVDGVKPENCHFNVYDLAATGNLGVSDDTTGETGGPMFLKTRVSASYDNVNINSFYISLFVDGSETRTPVGTIKNSRLTDDFNSVVYVWRNADINIENSEISRSGGPLLFLNAQPRSLLDAEVAGDVSKLYRTNVYLDSATYLSNYLEGRGGWFDIYSGASDLALGLLQTDAIFQGQFKTAFKKSDSSSGTAVDKMNLIALVLPVNGEGAALPTDKGGVNVSIYVDGKEVHSTLGGADKVLAAAATYAADSSDANKLAYVTALANTAYGNNLALNNESAPTILYRVNDAEGVGHFAMMNSVSGQTMLTSPLYAYTNDATYLSPDSVFGDPANQFLSVSMYGNDQGGDATKPAEYKGACQYGLLLGGFHKA